MVIKLFGRCFQVGLVLKFHETGSQMALAAAFGIHTEYFTLCHRDQSRSRQRRLEPDVQSVLDPEQKVSRRPSRSS